MCVVWGSVGWNEPPQRPLKRLHGRLSCCSSHPPYGQHAEGSGTSYTHRTSSNVSTATRLSCCRSTTRSSWLGWMATATSGPPPESCRGQKAWGLVAGWSGGRERRRRRCCRLGAAAQDRQMGQAGDQTLRQFSFIASNGHLHIVEVKQRRPLQVSCRTRRHQVPHRHRRCCKRQEGCVDAGAARAAVRLRRWGGCGEAMWSEQVGSASSRNARTKPTPTLTTSWEVAAVPAALARRCPPGCAAAARTEWSAPMCYGSAVGRWRTAPSAHFNTGIEEGRARPCC